MSKPKGSFIIWMCNEGKQPATVFLTPGIYPFSKWKPWRLTVHRYGFPTYKWYRRDPKWALASFAPFGIGMFRLSCCIFPLDVSPIKRGILISPVIPNVSSIYLLDIILSLTVAFSVWWVHVFCSTWLCWIVVPVSSFFTDVARNIELWIRKRAIW